MKVPVAVNCCIVPAGFDDVPGVTAMDTRAAAVTARFAVLLTDPSVAVITVPPWPALVAKPAFGAVALIVATPGTDELQVTELVTSCIELSVKVPIAVNCCFVPNEMEALPGVTAMDTSAAGVTATAVAPLMGPTVAEMLEEPTFALVVRPCVPAVLLTPAAAESELHVAAAVKSCVLPSVNSPVALSCTFVPRAIDGLAGVTVMETSAGGPTVSVVEPDTDPCVALIDVAP